MTTGTRSPPEARDRAVRLVLDHSEWYALPWAAIRSVAEKIGGSSDWYEPKAREREPSRQPARAQRDATLLREIRRGWDAHQL
jgi:hypothetical protein